MGWKAVADKLDGLATVQHAVITYNGTWGAGLVQYPGNVVNGLAQFVNPDLCVEVPCPYPAAFGPIGGSATAPSYQQSIQDAIDWTADWVDANPNQTFGLGGYSQGAEAASRVLIELQSGDLTGFMPNFIGGYTFGNPSKMAGAAAPGIGNPGVGWRGISSVNMTSLPTINGQVVWADYFHSKTNGDAANDLYPLVPVGAVGTVMTDFYTIGTEAQLNSPGTFLQNMITGIFKVISDSGILPASAGGLTGLLGLGAEAGLAFLIDLIGGGSTSATGVNADVEAAVLVLQFLTAPGGATGPHISYLGELPGYSNLVAPAVGFLNTIATLTPARA
jgi:hypothetical protein